jgi:ABC-type glycerol-3-phosphate transport system permease component
MIYEHVYSLFMKYLCALKNLLLSLVASTIIIYAINIIAGFAGADYVFTHGEAFVVWILMAILVNNCLKK